MGFFGRKGLSAGTAPQPAADSGISGPLFAGIQYVGMVAPPGTFVERATSPEPCQMQSGGAGLRFAIETLDGPGHAFVFPAFASIWLHAEPGPRPQIPTGMIEARAPGYGAAVAGMLRG
jgi:hypothetical protein